MSVVITLSFVGRTEEAVRFYQTAVDAEVRLLLRFRDGPDPSLMQPGMEDKIFHTIFQIGETEIRANDVGYTGPQSKPSFAGFSLAIKAESADQAERYFAALSDGGTVQMPLARTSFAPLYGIVIDRFGLSWKVMLA